MLAADKSNNLFRQSYMRGLLIFFYGLIWLAVALAGYLGMEFLFGATTGLGAVLITATWGAALTGALGGVTAMLTRLYRHVSIRQDFLQQSILSYFIEPLIGLVAGILSLYIITIPGALIVGFLTDLTALIANFSVAGLREPFANAATTLSDVSASSTFIAIHLLLAWMAGFHQRLGLGKLRSVTQRLAPNSQAAAETPLPASDKDAPLLFKRLYRERQQMVRWSFTWGLFLLIYGVIWFVGILASYILTWERLFASPDGDNPTYVLILAAWPAVAAGGCGGVFNIFYDLYQHVSVKQDFHRQHTMSYLVQPVIGLVFGLVIFLIVSSGYLALSPLWSSDGLPPVIDSTTIIMAQVVLGWIAGFRQQTVADLIQRIIKGIGSLFWAILSFFNPKNLFDAARRKKKLDEIKEQQADSIFELFNQPSSSRANERTEFPE